MAQLGTTGLELSRVGFGSWAVGGDGWMHAWGAQDDQDSIAAIRAAVEAGVNWIDTAPAYGLGHSERVVAEAISVFSDRDRPHVFTKCGMVWEPGDTEGHLTAVGNARSLSAQIEASLRRLDVEQLDVVHMHWPATGDAWQPNDNTPVEEYWGTLAELKASGKIRAIGLSNHSVEQLVAANAISHVDVIQPAFSAIDRSAASDVIPWAKENQSGVVVYSPMGSGLLAGRFSAERVASLPSNDWRKHSPAFTTDLSRNLTIAEAVRGVADRRGYAIPEVAVAWALAVPGVTAAIVGARSPEQVNAWIHAPAVELTPEDLQEIWNAGVQVVDRSDQG